MHHMSSAMSLAALDVFMIYLVEPANGSVLNDTGPIVLPQFSYSILVSEANTPSCTKYGYTHRPHRSGVAIEQP